MPQARNTTHLQLLYLFSFSYMANSLLPSLGLNYLLLLRSLTTYPVTSSSAPEVGTDSFIKYKTNKTN